MERNLLSDASSFQPVLQGCLGEFVRKASEYDACSSLANQFQSLVTDGVVHQFLGLLHSKSYIHATIAVGLDVLPCELLDVALSQSSQTGKEESFLQSLLSAKHNNSLPTL